MARGEGEREEAWPEEDPPLLDWCRAVRGSRSRAGAGGGVEDRAGGVGRGGGEGRDGDEDGERAATGDWDAIEDSDSIVMAGQEEEEDAGVMKVSTGTRVDSGPELEPTLEHDPEPEPELIPVWTFDGNGLIRSGF